MTDDRLDPRVARTRQQVLAAAAELLVEQGFERLCIEAVADRSDVARSTIYRNWPSPAHLLIEAFSTLVDKPDMAADSLRESLERLGRHFIGGFEGEAWGNVVPSLISAAAHDDEFRSALRDFSTERRNQFVEVIDAAVARGEIRAPDDPGAILFRFLGAFFFARYVAQHDLDDAFLRRQVDLTLLELGEAS